MFDFLPPALPEIGDRGAIGAIRILRRRTKKRKKKKPAAPWRPEGVWELCRWPDPPAEQRIGVPVVFEQNSSKKRLQGVSWEPADEKNRNSLRRPLQPSSLVTEAPPVPASIPEATALMGPISTTPLVADAWAAVSSPSSPEKSFDGDCRDQWKK